MRKFIIKSLFFPIGLLLLYVLIYFCFNAYLNRSFNEKNTVFVWGDSQAYRGIDINSLSNTINRKVYSSAHIGAGVYDFLLFSEQVSNNSTVIISLSKLVQIRRKENDYNRTGLSVWSIKMLYDNNYSFKEISSILKFNLKPKKNIQSYIELIPFKDSMKYSLPITHFEDYYEKTPPFLIDKQNLYLAGIKNLIKKNCKITFIEFPYHPELIQVEEESELMHKTEQFKRDVKSLFDSCYIDSIKINTEKNIFKDLSHLNELGAKYLSIKLGEKMLSNDRTTLYIAH